MKMKIKKYWSLLVLISVVIFSAIKFYGTKNYSKKIDVKTFQVNNNWGYDIVVDGKTFIHQNTIPAVEGNKLFSNEKDAQTVGILVKEKLLHKLNPSISKEQIDSCKIFY